MVTDIILKTALITLWTGSLLFAQISSDENKIFNLNGTDMFVRTLGKGEPLVIVHGGPGLAHDYLYEHFKQLSDQYRLIFYDQRGCGRSGELKENSVVTMDTLVGDLETLRKELKIEKMNLIGQSWGAIIALNYVFRYHSNVNKLLLLEPAPGSYEYLSEIQKTISERLSLSDKNKLTKITQSPEFKTDPVLFREFLTIRTNTYFYDTTLAKMPRFDYFDSSRVKKFFTSSAMFGPYLMNYNIYPDMENVYSPVLIIHGDADVIPNASVEKIGKALKKSELHIIKNCGHFVHIEKPDIYFGLLREFLGK